MNTDVSAQATVDAPGGDSRPGLSPGWVTAGATILALAIRLGNDGEHLLEPGPK